MSKNSIIRSVLLFGFSLIVLTFLLVGQKVDAASFPDNLLDTNVSLAEDKIDLVEDLLDDIKDSIKDTKDEIDDCESVGKCYHPLKIRLTLLSDLKSSAKRTMGLLKRSLRKAKCKDCPTKEEKVSAVTYSESILANMGPKISQLFIKLERSKKYGKQK